MRRLAFVIFAVSAALLLLPLRTVGDPVVHRLGHELVLDKKPFHFVGANLAIMHGPQNRAAAEAVLGGAAKDGIRVGRVWAFGEGDANAPAWLRDNFLFRAGPDGWIDAGPKHLDRVIAAAGRAGVRLVITLANNWGDYGGVPKYMKWAGVRDDAAAAYGATDRFYSDPKMRAFYRAHVERLLRRTNPITGTAYRDDPTILEWELINESTVVTTAGAEARRAWIGEMGKLVHSLDARHLVTPGVNVYRTESERREWLAVCQLPDVDVCDAHIYPEELLRNRDSALLESAVDDFVQLAQHVAGKPFVLGEFGIHGDDDGTWEHQTRGYWMGRILERLRFNGAAGGIVWLYQPAGGNDRRHGISIGEPTAEGMRAAIRTAAAAPVMPDDATNPDLGDQVGEVPLMPLHGEFLGKETIVPKVRADLASARVTWDPKTFDRAAWESTGVYGAGAVEHVWGTETGWFEYAYEVAAVDENNPKGKKPTRVQLPRVLTLRARVSSEYPGSVSPPDGASAFEVTLDGLSLGTATATRDDGRGAWAQIRSTDPAVLAAAIQSGKHRMRFVVAPGPKAHGLCVYGKPGEKAAGGAGRTGPIELRIDKG
ncbi:MAG: Endo,4-beta-mannosidase [Myxococcales bacterium]|nr:Endo,4-beta-mannosidase [Myxococcales bacterium]